MKTLDAELITIEKAIEAAAALTLKKMGVEGVKHARSTNLFKHGADFDSQITWQQEDEFHGKIVSGAEYSNYLEYGNNQEGDRIYPVHAKALHFWINGEEVFAKSVKAHGPLPFLEQAKDYIDAAAPYWFEGYLDTILGR
jgi:hypothetical protein